MLSYPSPSHDHGTMNSDRSYRSDNPFDIADDASERNQKSGQAKANPTNRLGLFCKQESSQYGIRNNTKMQRRHSSGSNIYSKEQKIKAVKT